MVERTDIHTLLQTGSWRTSGSARSRSPNPATRNQQHDSYDSYDRYDRQERSQRDERHERHERYDSRDNRDSRGRYDTYDTYDTYEPRKSNIGLPRSKRPPRAFVEDEEESLAKESTESVFSATSDEEPKHRGEVDQMPIILPVHEYNPERRFVIVPEGGNSEGGRGESDADKEFYDANTCRKYVLVSDDSGKEDKPDEMKGLGERKRRELPKRKSHQDLPRLDTHFDEQQQESASIRRSNSRRNREKAVVDQDPREHPKPCDEPDVRPPPDDAFLSPSVKHSTGGREREYRSYDTGRGGRSDHSPSARSDTRVASSDSRRPERPETGHPESPMHKRASSTANGSTREIRTQDRPRSAVYPVGDFEDQSNGFGNADDIMSFMAPGVNFNPADRRNGSPPRGPRGPRSNNSPPYYPRKAGDNMPIPIPIPYRPRSSHREQDGGYSSDDSYRARRRAQVERPYPTRSSLEPEYPALLSPDQARPGSPLPSPRTTQGGQFPDNSPLPSPRSATFPVDRSRRQGDRSMSPSPPVSTSPPRRFTDGRRGVPAGVHSRDTSISSGSVPPRRGPVASLSRQESLDPRSPVLYWQPGRFNPPEPSASNVTSLRRYSDDVAKGLLPQLPDCPWKMPVPARRAAGNGQFMMLRGAENFIVCPDCFGEVFEKSGFQHLFVAAPLRSDEQLISCDFGSNVWYRIAFILTMKNNYPDLRLMLGISAVAARQQPCGGNQPATRIWYSMMGSNARRPISSFTVCLSCAKTVEALLPNMAGVFVPLDSHEPTWGVCDFHYDPGRKRFIDYFDMMETTSDVAVRQRTAPDILELADRIRHLSLLEECSRDTPMPNRKWYVMENIPEFTVCEECFDHVVWPMLESDESGEIPRNFYRGRQTRPSAACQLYSTRMRNVFQLACQHNDMRMLESEVIARIRKQQEISNKYRMLLQEDQGDMDVQREMKELVRQWKIIE